MLSKNERLYIVCNALDQTIPNPLLTLIYKDPFHLLVATLLSAQCRDEQVNKVMPALITAASTCYDMAKLSECRISEIIHSCGFFKTKSHYISKLSKQLCENFSGEVPHTFEQLESLAGVGHKTASVVIGYAFNQPTFPVDTHIKRLAMRWKLSNHKTVEKIEKDLKFLFPKKDWLIRHMQIISFGRKFCNHTTCIDDNLCMICKKLNQLK